MDRMFLYRWPMFFVSTVLTRLKLNYKSFFFSLSSRMFLTPPSVLLLVSHRVDLCVQTARTCMSTFMLSCRPGSASTKGTPHHNLNESDSGWKTMKKTTTPKRFHVLNSYDLHQTTEGGKHSTARRIWTIFRSPVTLVADDNKCLKLDDMSFVIVMESIWKQHSVSGSLNT